MSLADKLKVFFGLTTVFVTLLLIGAFSVDQLEKQTSARLQVIHSTNVVQQIQSVADAVKDCETGQRGYVLTGDKAYLKPFYDAAPKVPKLIDELRHLTEEDAVKQGQLGALSVRTNEKIAELQETIDLVKDGHQPEALAIVKSNRGKNYMDEIRNIVADMIKSENDSLSARSAALNEQVKRTSLAISTLIGIATLILFIMSILVWRFVEARERSSIKIEKNRKELEDFFESAVVPMHWIDGKGTLIKVNAAECELLGYKREELIGRNIAEFHTDQDALETIFYTLRSNEPLQGFEAKMRTHDGTIKTVLIDSNVQFEDGKFIHSRCFTRDITMLKKQEIELRERELRNRILVQTAPDAILTFDKDGIIESSNEAGGAIFGCLAEDMIGRDLRNFLPGFFSDAEHMNDIEKVTTGQSKIFGVGREINGVDANGAKIPLELAWSVLNVNKRTIFTAIIRSIARRKELERRLSLQYEVARILSEVHGVQNMGEQLLAAIGKLMNWSTGGFWLIDKTEQHLNCTQVWSAHGQVEEKFLEVCKSLHFESGVGLPGRTWRTATAHNIEDLAVDNNFQRKPVALDCGLKSGFAFPLLSGSRVLGVFEFFSDEYVVVDEQMTQTMFALGAQIGQFIVRAEAEEAQRLTDERFKAVFDQTFQFMGLLSPDGKVQLANQTALKFEGITEQEVIGTPFWLTPWWAHSRSAQRQLKEAVEAVNAGEKLVRFETEHVSSSGDTMLVDFTLKPILTEDNTVHMLIAEGRDVTERRLAEEELKASEGRFRQMAENIREIFWITDAKGSTPIYVSPAFEQIFGYSVKSLLENPRQFFESIHEDDREKFAHLMRHQKGSRTPSEIEYRIVRNDGSIRWLWVRACSLFDSNGILTGLCGVTHDITERRDAEIRVSEFYSTVSHELRTPLTSIRGSLGLIEGGKTGEIPPVAMQMIKIGRAESDRLIRLINDILDIKKLEAGHMEFNAEPVDPHKLVSKTISAITGMATEYGVNLKNSVVTSHEIFADPERLTQVITNLVSNAIKFSPKEGIVTVSVRTRPNDFLRFSVIDEGPGIPADQKHKLFGMFQQLDSTDTRRVGGTGLGLAISKSIVEQHGGKIGVDSVEGHGATFWFEIPVGRKAGVPDASKVLVVESDQAFSQNLEEISSGSTDYEFIFADSLSHAQDELDKFRPSLIFIDVDKFENGVPEFVAACHKQAGSTNTPVVLTGSEREKSKFESFRPKLLWVDKPLAKEQMQEAFATALKVRNGEPSKVLIVEDDAPTSEILLQQIGELEVVCDLAKTGVEAIEKAKDGIFDLIILDLGLPLMDGYEVVQSLREGSARNTPLIIYTNRDLSKEDKFKLSLGLTTYFIKSRASENELLDCVRKLLNKNVG